MLVNTGTGSILLNLLISMNIVLSNSEKVEQLQPFRTFFSEEREGKPNSLAIQNCEKTSKLSYLVNSEQ